MLGKSQMIRDFTLTQSSQILLTNENLKISQHILIVLKLLSLIVRVLVCRTSMLQVFLFCLQMWRLGFYPWP